MNKKKSHGVLIAIIVIALLAAGCGGFVWYIKKKLFNTDYIGCYEKIAKLEKSYESKNTSSTGDIALLKSLVTKKKGVTVTGETKRTIKVKGFDPYGGTVTFILNGDSVMGRCAKHEDKYLDEASNGKKVYRHSVYLTQTFEKNTPLNNQNLQAASFYYESGSHNGSYPQVIIHKKHYAVMPYYDTKTQKVTCFLVKNTNPYEKDGATLKVITHADGIYVPAKDKWALGSYDLTKDVTPKGKLVKSTNYEFPKQEDA
jgi:hypothetical protein